MDLKYVFPKVKTKKQPRTNFDLSHAVRTSFAPCLSIPIMDIETLPTDSFNLKLQSLIESLPMVAPALGRWKARFKFFINPMSNLYSWMDNNEKLSTEDWLNRNCHCFKMPFAGLSFDTGSTDISVLDSIPKGVQSSSLFQYLGLPLDFKGNGWTYESQEQGALHLGHENEVVFNAEGLLTYFDIVRNYCVNNQEQNFPMVASNSDYLDVHTEHEPVVNYYPLYVLDMWFKALRQFRQGCSDVFDISEYTNAWSALGYDNTEVQAFNQFIHDLKYSYLVPLGGLVCTPYLMDFNRGIMNSSVGDIEASVLIDEDTKSFSIPQLQFKNKMQNLVNHLDISGGRFADVLSSVWQSHLKGGVDKPIFLGSRSEWIYMTDIIATATTGKASDSESSTLGQQGGFVAGRTRNDKRTVCNFSFNEYGRFMCIFQLVPEVSYSSGIDLQLQKKSFSDKYIPQYSQIGYQDVSNHELTSIPASIYSLREDIFDEDGNSVAVIHRVPIPDVEENSLPYKVGKRIAWSEYTTRYPKLYGEFAQGGTFDYWALVRRYAFQPNYFNPAGQESRRTISFSTYAMPYLFNYLFVDQSVTAQNFRLQVYFTIKAKRPLPKRAMPRL